MSNASGNRREREEDSSSEEEDGRANANLHRQTGSSGGELSFLQNPLLRPDTSAMYGSAATPSHTTVVGRQTQGNYPRSPFSSSPSIPTNGRTGYMSTQHIPSPFYNVRPSTSRYFSPVYGTSPSSPLTHGAPSMGPRTPTSPMNLGLEAPSSVAFSFSATQSEGVAGPATPVLPSNPVLTTAVTDFPPTIPKAPSSPSSSSSLSVYSRVSTPDFEDRVSSDKEEEEDDGEGESIWDKLGEDEDEKKEEEKEVVLGRTIKKPRSQLDRFRQLPPPPPPPLPLQGLGTTMVESNAASAGITIGREASNPPAASPSPTPSHLPPQPTESRASCPSVAPPSHPTNTTGRQTSSPPVVSLSQPITHRHTAGRQASSPPAALPRSTTAQGPTVGCQASSPPTRPLPIEPITGCQALSPPVTPPKISQVAPEIRQPLPPAVQPLSTLPAPPMATTAPALSPGTVQAPPPPVEAAVNTPSVQITNQLPPDNSALISQPSPLQSRYQVTAPNTPSFQAWRNCGKEEDEDGGPMEGVDDAGVAEALSNQGGGMVVMDVDDDMVENLRIGVSGIRISPEPSSGTNAVSHGQATDDVNMEDVEEPVDKCGEPASKAKSHTTTSSTSSVRFTPLPPSPSSPFPAGNLPAFPPQAPPPAPSELDELRREVARLHHEAAQREGALIDASLNVIRAEQGRDEARQALEDLQSSMDGENPLQARVDALEEENLRLRRHLSINQNSLEIANTSLVNANKAIVDECEAGKKQKAKCEQELRRLQQDKEQLKDEVGRLRVKPKSTPPKDTCSVPRHRNLEAELRRVQARFQREKQQLEDRVEFLASRQLVPLNLGKVSQEYVRRQLFARMAQLDKIAADYGVDTPAEHLGLQLRSKDGEIQSLNRRLLELLREKDNLGRQLEDLEASKSQERADQALLMKLRYENGRLRTNLEAATGEAERNRRKAEDWHRIVERWKATKDELLQEIDKNDELKNQLKELVAESSRKSQTIQELKAQLTPDSLNVAEIVVSIDIAPIAEVPQSPPTTSESLVGPQEPPQPTPHAVPIPPVLGAHATTPDPPANQSALLPASEVGEQTANEPDPTPASPSSSAPPTRKSRPWWYIAIVVMFLITTVFNIGLAVHLWRTVNLWKSANYSHVRMVVDLSEVTAAGVVVVIVGEWLHTLASTAFAWVR